MYARKVGDEVLSFGHEGLLWKGRGFVMYDRSNDDLWSAVTGECLRGERAGQQLEMLPASIMPWKRWKELHPETLVMKVGRRTGNRFMGSARLAEGRLRGLVLALGLPGAPTSWDLAGLARKKVDDAVIGGQPLLAVYSERARAAVIYRRNVEDEGTFTFLVAGDQEAGNPGDAGPDGKPAGPMVLEDQETGSRWLAMTGECVEGPMEGMQLLPVPATPFTRDEWLKFHEGGKILLDGRAPARKPGVPR